MGKVPCKMGTRLSVTLQQPHRIMSHRTDRAMHSSKTQSYMPESELYLLIVHAWLYSLSMAGFLLPGKHFWFFNDLPETVLSPGNADITPFLHQVPLAMVLCIFPKITIGAQPCVPRHPNGNWLTDVLDSQGVQEGTQTKRLASTKISPSLLGFQWSLRLY